MRGAWLILSAAVYTSGCELLGVGCDPVLRPGVSVAVVDSVTSAPLEADSILVLASDGEFQDTARYDSGRTAFIAIYDRPGVYNIRVEADGYRNWSASEVRVDPAGKCSNRTTEVVALMQR